MSELKRSTSTKFEGIVDIITSTLFYYFIAIQNGICAYAITLFFLSLQFTISAQTPIAYYPFDNSPADLSGNGNNGVIHGNVKPVADRFGKNCAAYEFDGSTGYIEVPSSLTLERPVTSLTISTWYKFTKAADSYWLTVLSKGLGNTENNFIPQFRLQSQQNSKSRSSICAPLATPGFSTISLNTAFTICDQHYVDHPFQPYEWAFYCLVFTGSEVLAYQNDKLIFRTDYSSTLGVNKMPMFIGYDSPGSEEYFEGCLDDLRIFSEALNSQEVMQLFKEQRQRANASGEFGVDSVTDKTVYLTSGNKITTINFEAPKVKNFSCDQLSITQIAGPRSGTSVPAGRFIVTYKIQSENGNEEHLSFRINVLEALTPVFPASPVPIKSESTIAKVAMNNSNDYHPPDVDLREKKNQGLLEVNSDSLELVIYDNAAIDGDTVSIFFNMKAVVIQQRVTDQGRSYWIKLDREENELLMFAENLGSIPPNTALLVLVDGKERHEIRLSSSLKQSGTIHIKKRK